MKKKILLFTILLPSIQTSGQSVQQDVLRWQHHYKAEFLTDARSPVKGGDTAYLRFFEISGKWCAAAAVILTPEARPFDMATHSGKTKRFRQYAILKFADPRSRSRRQLTLSAYERVDRPASDTQAARTLFIPFQDRTNGDETYGGGRYIDLVKSDIKAGTVLLDFNKAYNPYCAFGEGFSCPIPPAENRLGIKVTAGEKLPVPPLLPRE